MKQTKQHKRWFIWGIAATFLFLGGALLYLTKDITKTEREAFENEIIFYFKNEKADLPVGTNLNLYNNDLHGTHGYIAHAGGCIDGLMYTNSLEALNDSIHNNFRFIELDLLETADGRIVAAHDWELFSKLTGIHTEKLMRMTCKEIQQLNLANKYTILDGETIARIVKENPQIILVTDKITNYDLLIKTIPYPEQMIVETFNAGQYFKAKDKGIKYAAFCIDYHEHSLDLALKYKIPLVTVYGGITKHPRIRQKLALLHQNKTCVLMYSSATDTRNPEFIKANIGTTCSKIYVEELPSL